MADAEDGLLAACFVCSLPVLLAVACALAILPICMIVIGSVYLKDCPTEPLIPIYLIVAGAVMVLTGCCSTSQADEQNRAKRRVNVAGILFNIFNLAWFIFGSVVVFRAYKPSFDEKSENYCHKTVYLFAFVILVIEYAFVCLSIIYIIMWGCCRSYIRRSDV